MKEDRKYIRYECDLIVAVAIESGRILESKGRSHNLSQGGIKFETGLNLDVESYCKIAFELKDTFRYFDGIILRKNKNSDKKMYSYALEFNIKLSESDLQALLKLNTN